MAHYDCVSASTAFLEKLFNNQSCNQLRVQKVSCSHTWTIDNFSQCDKKTGEFLTSPEFFDAADSKLKWCLHLYPEGKTEKSESFISLYLCLSISVGKPVNTKYKLSLVNSEGELIRRRSNEVLFEPETSDVTFGREKFVERSVLFGTENAFLLDDKLIVNCELSYYITKKALGLPENLASLLESENLSDVTLRVQGKEFRSHKAILAANSPVFSALFEHDMKEKGNNLVDIEDFDGKAIGTMLRYMYTGETALLDMENAKHVLAASDKYDIDDLKSFCEEYLSSKLSVPTAADLLYFAEHHNAEKLKECSLKFIRDHMGRVLHTAFWKLLDNPQKQLLLAAFKTIASQVIP